MHCTTNMVVPLSEIPPRYFQSSKIWCRFFLFTVCHISPYHPIWITACCASSWASLAVRDFWGTTKKNSFLPVFNQEGISNTHQTKTQFLTLLPVAAHYCPLLSIVAHCCPFCCPSLAARPTNRGERRPLKSLSKIKKNIESERNIVNQEELKKKLISAAERR